MDYRLEFGFEYAGSFDYEEGRLTLKVTSDVDNKIPYDKRASTKGRKGREALVRKDRNGTT